MKSAILLASNFETAVPAHTSDAEIVAHTRQEGLADGFCCWLDHMHGRQDPPAPREAEHLIVTFWPNNPYNARRASQRGLSIEQYVEWAMAGIERAARELGPRFLWCIGWETFDPRQWCQPDGAPPGFASRRDAFAFYQRWITTALQTKHWRNSVKFGDDRHNSRPCALEWLAQHGRTVADSNVIIGAHYASHAAYAFETVPDARAFWWECGITMVNLQVGFPFVRGAARQYHRQWLADVSPFCYPHPAHPAEYYTDLGEWGQLEGATRGLSRPRLNFPKYTPDGVRLAGYTPEMLLRCWLTAVMAGCDYLFQEASSVTHFVRRHDRLELTPVGRAAQQLARFQRRLDDRGEPVTPVALWLDFHHGIEPYTLEQPWAFCPRTAGDEQILGFFRTAYPGHSEPARPAPWSDPAEYGEMLRAGFDFRPYERRLVCAGRWPDLFDVYLTNASAATFERSRLILALGDHTLDAAQQEFLLQQAARGKTVVAALNQFAPDGPLRAGLRPRGKPQTATAILDPCTGQRAAEDPFRVQPVDAPGWETVLLTADAVPVLLCRTHATGTLWLFTVPFALDERGQLLRSWSELLDRLIAPLCPVRVSGPPLQRLLNRTASGYLLTLINHEPTPWQGVIELPGQSLRRVRERWEEQPVDWTPTATGPRITLTVPSYAARVLDLELLA